MSLSNCIRIPLLLENIDVFTFGESSMFGYDSLNNCLIVYSLIELKNLNDQSIDRFHFSSTPSSPIQRLILNQDETIIALISDKTGYLVYLPQSKNLLSKDSRLCPINVIPSSSSLINNRLIDFVWLSPIHFVIVNSIPSSSQCHLCIVRPSKQNGIEFIQTFSVGSSLTEKVTPNKQISLHQPSDIIKLDIAKRKDEDFILILLFAMKTDGDIFIMEIDQHHLLNSEKLLSSEFVGPLRLIPSMFDNYGADHSHSSLLCLSCSNNPVVIFNRGKCEFNECFLLNPKLNEYYLLTIDSISFTNNENNKIIKLMISDRLNSNRYYISDSLSNVYQIEISSINQIKKTNVKYLITTNNHFIIQMGLIQTKNKGQWLAIINKTRNNQQKELILVRPHSLSFRLSPSIPFKSRQSIQRSKSNLSTTFIERIRSLLAHRDQSLSNLILSSSNQNISDSDFDKILLKFVELFSEEYIEKQEKVRIELENKQKYLTYFEQTQSVAQKELNQKIEQIKKNFQNLMKNYQQELSRRNHLTSSLGDILSVVEQHTPVISDQEILLQQKLQRYQIQINYLKEKTYLLRRFIPTQYSNGNQQPIDQSSMEDIQVFVDYYKKEIDRMKQQLKGIYDQN